MRQRVLLVAGWVVAAAVTSLVASGAVAVAGGQVYDRPLSKVLAADVAALPDAEADCEPSTCVPPASGGPDSTADLTTVGAQNGPGSSLEPDPVGDDEGNVDLGSADPARPDGLVPTIPPDELGPTPDPGEAGPDFPVTTPARVVNAAGGQMAFVVQDERPVVQWFLPRPGYSATVDDGDATSVTVTFTPTDELSYRSPGPSIVTARWEDGELVVEVLEP